MHLYTSIATDVSFPLLHMRYLYKPVLFTKVSIPIAVSCGSDHELGQIPPLVLSKLPNVTSWWSAEPSLRDDLQSTSFDRSIDGLTKKGDHWFLVLNVFAMNTPLFVSHQQDLKIRICRPSDHNRGTIDEYKTATTASISLYSIYPLGWRTDSIQTFLWPGLFQESHASLANGEENIRASAWCFNFMHLDKPADAKLFYRIQHPDASLSINTVTSQWTRQPTLQMLC